jgi:hypothetical protein
MHLSTIIRFSRRSMLTHPWHELGGKVGFVGIFRIFKGYLRIFPGVRNASLDYHSFFLRSMLTHPWHELGGKVNISCSKTGFSSSITFHTKPMYGGIRDQITGEVKHLPSGRVVCRINGQWTEKIEMTFPDKGVGSFFFGFVSCHPFLSFVRNFFLVVIFRILKTHLQYLLSVFIFFVYPPAYVSYHILHTISYHTIPYNTISYHIPLHSVPLT